MNEGDNNPGSMSLGDQKFCDCVSLEIYRSGLLIGYCENYFAQGVLFHALSVWRSGGNAPITLIMGGSRVEAYRNLKAWFDRELEMKTIDRVGEILMPTNAIPVLMEIVGFMSEMLRISMRLREGSVSDREALEMKATLDKICQAAMRELVEHYPRSGFQVQRLWDLMSSKRTSLGRLEV